MTNQELKKKVISSMKKDDELKKYVKDMQDLSNDSFDILVKIIDKAYLKVKNK
jgi:acetone carboxylase gamma subunit|tara:strand:+ start:496 stop:654 length:159 start_codon:yes stop_codon:yes gene_type:complete